MADPTPVPPTSTDGPAEVASGYVVPDTSRVVPEAVTGAGPLVVTADVMVTPTQVRRPWKATVRSIFQMGVALATLLPFIAAGIYDDVDQAPAYVAQVLVVAGGVTRVMALPQVEKFLQDWVPWLAAAPAAITKRQRSRA